MTMRKNQSTLSADEKSRFVAAVKALKANGTYDHHVLDHRTAFFSIKPDPAHVGPAFFPWHRECLKRFELNLQSIDPSVTIPYWDPTVDNSASSSIWAADFMGGNGQGSTWQVASGRSPTPRGSGTSSTTTVRPTRPTSGAPSGCASRACPRLLNETSP